MRFGLLAMSSTQDVRFSEEKVAQGQQLANKLWNASRLVLLGVAEGAQPEPRPVTAEDRWILGRLIEARTQALERIDGFDFARAALGLYDFIYGELCDWYLELVKPRLYEHEPELSSTLLYVLRETLALAHPLTPFVTEEIWSYLPGEQGLLAGWRPPEPDLSLRDVEAEGEVDRLIEAVQALRSWRDLVQVPAGARVPALLEADGYDGVAEQVARLARFEFTGDGADPVASVTVPGGVVQRARGRRLRPRGGRAPARETPPRAEGRDRSRRGQAGEREASSYARRRTWSTPSAPSSRACARSGTPCERGAVVAGSGRGLPALARAVRDALRARPHAPADDGDGLAAATLRRRSTWWAPTASPRPCG